MKGHIDGSDGCVTAHAFKWQGWLFVAAHTQVPGNELFASFQSFTELPDEQIGGLAAGKDGPATKIDGWGIRG